MISKKESKALDRIIEACEKWRKKKFWDSSIKEREGERWQYSFAKSIIKKLDYMPNDVTEFSKQLIRFPDSSYFLAALVNLAREDEVTLDVRECPIVLNHLGYLNEKKLKIKGDVGSWLGLMMKKGEIIVEGNAGDSVGHSLEGGKIVVKGNVGSLVGVLMKDGEIRIDGDAEYSLGYAMKGGTIVVAGSAGQEVGANMVGGEIWVNGTIGSLGYGEYGEDRPRGGKIYEKGKQIYPKT